MENTDPSEQISWKDSLATRFSLTTVILVVMVILVVGAFLIWTAYQTEQQNVLDLQKKNADTIALLMSTYIDSARDKILVFEESVFLDSLSPENQKTILTDFLIHQKTTFSQFTILDLQGNEITRVSRFHTYIPGEMGSRRTDPVFIAATENRVLVSPIYISPESGLLSMQIGLPLNNQKGDVVGALIAEVNCVQLWQAVSQQDVGSIGYAYISDKSGRLIAYQDISEVLNRYNEDLSYIPPVADFIADKPHGNHVYQYMGFSGEQVVGTYSPIDGTDWAVIAELPENEAFSGIRQMVFYLFTIFISCMIISGGVGYLMSIRLTHPIEDLTQTARKLKSGDWDTKIHHTERLDEVGVLSRSFAQMRDELRNLYSNLEGKLEELTRIQVKLLQSEEQYRTIFENNGNALLLVEEDMTVSLINHELEELLGYSKSEIEGRVKWTELIANEDDLFRMKQHHIGRRQQDVTVPTSYEFSFEAKSGDKKDVIATVTMIPGSTRSLVAIIDITEKKQVESALIQARKKLSLLNTITFNDIRSNAYVLAGYVDLKGDSISDPDILNWIEKERSCIRNIDAALVFAKDYQDLGLKPAGWQSVEPVFLYAISHLDLSHITRDLNLSGLEIYADPLLEKVFFILASYILSHGGDVTRISIFSVRSDNEVIIVFEDNGTGISESDKTSIFSEFIRVNKGISLFLRGRSLVLLVSGSGRQECMEKEHGLRLSSQEGNSGFRSLLILNDNCNYPEEGNCVR